MLVLHDIRTLEYMLPEASEIETYIGYMYVE